MIRRILVALTRLLPEPRVIFDRDGREPYLSRWYLTGRPKGEDGEPVHDVWGREQGDAASARPAAPRLGGLAVYLHRFHRSDEANDLHNHPWSWACSLILAGGYSEERRHGVNVRRRTVRPGRLNFISGDTFHRVDLLEEDAWSLFVVGPKIGSWGFWDRESGLFSGWREYIRDRRAALAEALESPAAKDRRELAEGGEAFLAGMTAGMAEALESPTTDRYPNASRVIRDVCPCGSGSLFVWCHGRADAVPV